MQTGLLMGQGRAASRWIRTERVNKMDNAGTNPLFSIVIPAYNAERYLQETLHSVALQQFDDFEAIVVDDGSTDGTREILSGIADSRLRFRVLRQENAGPLMARRMAISYARGEYVVFLDSDDLLRDDALMVLAREIERTGADIVSFPFSRVPDFSVSQRVRIRPGEYRDKRYAKVKECVCRGCFNNLCGKAVRLCRIDMDSDYGAYKGLVHGEDLFQLLPIIDRFESLVQINEPLYYYRDNGSSSTSRFRRRQLDDVVVVSRGLTEYASKWGGACIKAASVGEASLYISLLNLLDKGAVSREEKMSLYRVIRSTMLKEGAFERCSIAVQRFDYWLILCNLRQGHFTVVEKLIRAAGLARRIRNRSVRAFMVG